MALTYNQITAITEKHFIKVLKDNVYGSNALIARMTQPGKLETFDGGERIMAPVISSKPGANRWFTGNEVLDTSPTDNITAAEFLIKQLYEPIRITRLEELKNSSEAGKIKLVTAKMQIAEKSMRDNLANGLFSDGATGVGGVNQITGLQAVMSTSSTYGGIAVADMADWVAVVDGNSGVNRTLTLNLMQKVYGAAKYDSDEPSVLVSKQDVYNVYWALLQPHQRLVSEEMTGIGFKNVIEFNGKPYIVDSHMEANAIYMLNEDFCKLYVHSQENMRFEKLEKVESTATTLGKIFWAGNLVVNGRRFQAKLDDVTAS